MELRAGEVTVGSVGLGGESAQDPIPLVLPMAEGLRGQEMGRSQTWTVLVMVRGLGRKGWEGPGEDTQQCWFTPLSPAGILMMGGPESVSHSGGAQAPWLTGKQQNILLCPFASCLAQ